jgi:hypothetical protein
MSGARETKTDGTDESGGTGILGGVNISSVMDPPLLAFRPTHWRDQWSNHCFTKVLFQRQHHDFR